jgi:recombination protein RecA
MEFRFVATSHAQIEELRKTINKAVGRDDALQRGSDQAFKVEYLPTGLLPFDILLQGGIPRGRFTSIQGDWSTLKSYVAYHTCAMVQRSGGVASVIDTEHSFDVSWARAIGIDVDKLIVMRPDSGEEAMDAAEALTRAQSDLVVFDSVAAALPQAEKDKRLHGENIQPGRQAALMSAAARKITTANTKTAFLWINQLRENIGITFGPREKAPGGRALPFYSSMMLEVRKTGKITRDEKMYTGDKWQNGKMQIGQKFKAELIKSKLNKPFREVWFDWSLETSEIDLVGFMVAQGLEQGLITLSGNTWKLDGLKAVGREKFKAKVASDPEALRGLEMALRRAHGLRTDMVHNGRAKPINKPPARKKSLRKTA